MARLTGLEPATAGLFVRGAQVLRGRGDRCLRCRHCLPSDTVADVLFPRDHGRQTLTDHRELYGADSKLCEWAWGSRARTARLRRVRCPEPPFFADEALLFGSLSGTFAQDGSTL